MPLKGLFNPKNAAKSSGGFKEGFVHVDASTYRVHRGKSAEGEPERQPVLALVWAVTRLDEDQANMTTDEGEPITEEIVFSAGGKSLAQLHPGRADSPEDHEIEDAGVAVNAEGPTIHIVNQEWHPHEKASLTQLMESLKEKGVKEEYMDRVWAPDWVDCVFYLKNKVTGDKMQRPGKDGKLQDYDINYKVVEKIVRGPGQAKSSKKSNGKADSSGLNGKSPEEAEQVVGSMLNTLSTEKDGEKMTRKALNVTLARMVAESGSDPKLQLAAMTLVKSDAWLAKNGPKYDIVFNPADNNVHFGAIKDA